MKILHFTSLVVMALLSTVVLATALHDFSPFDTVNLDVKLRTFDIGENIPGIFYEVHTPYTNPVVCDITLTVPLTHDGNDGAYEVSQSKIIIFPLGAFEHKLSYKVAAPVLSNNSFIKENVDVDFVGAASCHGWSFKDRLPQRACLSINPRHKQSCIYVRQANKDYYPIFRNDLHLGDCGC